MEIPERVIFKNDFIETLTKAQDELLPEAKRVHMRIQDSRKLHRAVTKAKKNDFPLTVCETFKGRNNRIWKAIITVLSKNLMDINFYTQVNINGENFLLKYLNNSPNVKWDVIFPSFFKEYRELFYHKYFDETLNDQDLIEDFFIFNPMCIPSIYTMDENMHLRISYDEMAFVELSKGDQLHMYIQKDGVKLGYVRHDLHHYNHFVPYCKIAEKESLKEFYEIAKVLTSESRYLAIEEENLHYQFKLDEVCTKDCYMELMSCLA